MNLRCISCFFTFLISINLALAQLPYNPSPFNAIGQLQGATVTNASDVLSGGTLRVNDITIVVPKNMLVTLPSITVSWAECFNPDGSFSLTGGLEVSVLANRLGNTYIAGIIYIFQELLHVSSGFITNIDYTTGELRIGGDPANAGSTGTRIIINDPVGRYGLVHSQSPLFTADTDNPSIRASTGFPLCVPRTNPATTDDPLCPRKNRPLGTDGKPLPQFNFGAPPVANGAPDPNLFAPLMVGDWVTWSGINVGGGLWSVYSLEANLGIFTAAGKAPVYITIDVAQWGIVGSTRGEVAETRIQGYTTDETQNIEVFAIDVDPCTGVETERVLGVVVPRATGRRGQWRYRPGTNVSPATREVGARVQAGATTNGNGITTGKFIQPIMDDGFIFPELNIFGEAQIIYEFELLRHLAQGSGPWLGGLPGSDPDPNGPIAGQLDPWPGAVAPPKATCSQTTPAQTPKANAGSDQAVTSGAVVTLSGRSDTTNIPENTITFLWEQVVGTGPIITLSGANTKTATFTAPASSTTLTFRLTTSNSVGSTTDTVVITVSASTGVDTITIVSFTASNSKGVGQLNVSARSSVLDGSSTLSIEVFDPNVAPTPMVYSGNNDGLFTILINTKKPKSFTIRSSRGATKSQTV